MGADVYADVDASEHKARCYLAAQVRNSSNCRRSGSSEHAKKRSGSIQVAHSVLVVVVVVPSALAALFRAGYCRADNVSASPASVS